MKPFFQRAAAASIVVLATAAAAPSAWAGGNAGPDRARATGPALQVVPNAAAAGEPGHGWRYFSDPRAHRAVVISPDGDYYFSRGKGLRRIASTQDRA